MLKFEKLEHDITSLNYLYRAKVTGGWLMIASQDDNEEGMENIKSSTFMPDPNHEWDGGSIS